MMRPQDWQGIRGILDDLYRATDRLEALFPGRKFTLDGHLVGSIGEVIAAYMFDLQLAPPSSKAHDAIASDGRLVEVKLTQGTSVAMRHETAQLLVLHRAKGGSIEVVYNGPGGLAWKRAGKLGSNGQRPITLNALRALNSSVDMADRLPQVRYAPI